MNDFENKKLNDGYEAGLKTSNAIRLARLRLELKKVAQALEQEDDQEGQKLSN